MTGNPAQAEEGTIRKKFAASIGENAIHGSDAEETAAFEIGYFPPDPEESREFRELIAESMPTNVPTVVADIVEKFV